MKNTTIYAILHNNQNGTDIRKVEIRKVRIDEQGCISARVYNGLMRTMRDLPAAAKGESWHLRTEDGLKANFGGCPAIFRVKFC